MTGKDVGRLSIAVTPTAPSSAWTSAIVHTATTSMHAPSAIAGSLTARVTLIVSTSGIFQPSNFSSRPTGVFSSRPAFSGPPGPAAFPEKTAPPGGAGRAHFFGASEVSAATKASCGTSTRPIDFIRFFPSFCFSSSLRLRVMSPP